jgi:hypothetical protein
MRLRDFPDKVVHTGGECLHLLPVFLILKDFKLAIYSSACYIDLGVGRHYI